MTRVIDPFSLASITLTGPQIACRIMVQDHLPRLEDASRALVIWEHMMFDASDPTEFPRYAEAMPSGYWIREYVPIAIFHKGIGRVAGTHKLMRISVPDARLTLGGAWINPEFWGIGLSGEVHHHLFGYALDTLGVNWIKIRIHTWNVRRLKGMEIFGLIYEDTLRRSVTARNVQRNDAACFSMLAKDWAKPRLKPNNLISTALQAALEPSVELHVAR